MSDPPERSPSPYRPPASNKRASIRARSHASNQQIARNFNNRAIWLVAIGRPHQAVQCFRRACKLFPQMTTTWLNLAALHMLMGRRNEAIRTIKQALEAGALSHIVADSRGHGLRGGLPMQHLLEKLVARCAAFSMPRECWPILTKGWHRRLVKPIGLLRTSAFGTTYRSRQPPIM